MTKINVCKKCKWFKNNGRSHRDTCSHTLALSSIDMIYGEVYYTELYEARNDEGFCKEEGLFFEPKLSLLQRIFPRAKPQ